MNIGKQDLFVELPKTYFQRLPKHQDIRRIEFPGHDHPDYSKYETQRNFDEAVLQALTIGGFEDRCCPREGRWVAASIASAILHVTFSRILEPSSCWHLSGGDYRLFRGLWQLSWQCLDRPNRGPGRVFASRRLKQSLYRLMVHKNITGDSRDGGFDTCLAAELWENLGYCPGDGFFEQVALWAYKKGPCLEVFTLEEQDFLRSAIVGMARMPELIAEKIPARFRY